MMRTCPSCGFEGQAGARFCRQCGGPLFVEREANLSETRQQSHPGASYSQDWAGERGSYQSSETSRFMRQPMPAGAPFTVPVPRNNAHAFWALTGLICGVAMCGLVLASLLSFKPGRTPIVTRDTRSSEIREDVRREAERAARQAEELARLSAEKARMAGEIARAAGEVAKAKGALAQATDGLSLNSLIYPNSSVTKRVSTGNAAGVMNLETADDIAQVRAFYAARLGEPRTSSRTSLTFAQSERGVDVTVKVGPGASKGRLEISVARSGPRSQ